MASQPQTAPPASLTIRRPDDWHLHLRDGAMLRAVLSELRGRIAAVSSFGAESAVLLHMVAAVDRAVPVIFTDTQKMFPETLAYRAALAVRLGLADLRVFHPDPRLITARDAAGERKGFQAGTRAALPRFEADQGRLKINPLADWSKPDLDAYFATHALPRHPLEAQGYLSIGCAPCTSQVRPGEDPRAGRWRGFDKVECGIHQPVAAGGEPIF